MLHDVQLTVLLLDSVNRFVLYVTSLADTLVWLIHVHASVHVSVIDHPIHHAIHIGAGVHQVHSGPVVSLHAHVNIVLLDMDTLLDGFRFQFHFGVLYPFAVLQVIVHNVTLQL